MKLSLNNLKNSFLKLQRGIINYQRNLNNPEITTKIIIAEYYKKDLKLRNNWLEVRLNIKDYVKKIKYIFLLLFEKEIKNKYNRT